METRASRKRAAAAVAATTPVQIDTQPLKKQRVVLGELTNLSNLIFPLPANLIPQKQKLQPRKNPGLKKQPITLPLDVKVEKFDDPHGGSECYEPSILNYLREMEMQKKRRPMVDYIEEVQREVTENMRGILVDWLVEVAEEYKLLSESLFLSVSYVDRFLSINPVKKGRLQLLGVTSMLVASKYEEIDPPNVRQFCSITDYTYNKAEVVEMEADILRYLNFEMGNPTAITFLKRFTEIDSKNQKTPNLQIEFLSNYLAELSLMDYECIRFLPSVIAASAIFLARFILSPDDHPWTPSLQEYTGYQAIELKACVLILHDLYLARRCASLRAVRQKYRQHKFKYVANFPSPPEVPKFYFDPVIQLD
ncbi:putative cyclin-A3-1 [Lotus japonicus]|uniref:putative cyclin-A3-1 n=1 Tax=Lotus japonicus TaxID=34305 RepID=UPI00258291C8|nr:putative cyclin-A3-1 [Lotus japonicus]